MNRTIEFFIPMRVPTVTHQEKKVSVVNGKPHFYEPPELADARNKFETYFAPHRPEKPFTGTVRLMTKWLFPVTGKHRSGEYKATKPDTDNMIKLLKDVMTKLEFWGDDAQVASEITEKFWSDRQGIYVKIEKL